MLLLLTPSRLLKQSANTHKYKSSKNNIGLLKESVVGVSKCHLLCSVICFLGELRAFILGKTDEWDGNMWALLQQSQWIHRNYHGGMTCVLISLFITDPAEAWSLRPISHWIKTLLRLTGQEAQGHAKWVENGNDISFWPDGLLNIPDRMHKDQKVLLEHLDNGSATRRRELFRTKTVRKIQWFRIVITCLFASLIPHTVYC